MSSVIRLDLLAGNDAGDGSSWAAAKRTFAGALSAVSDLGSIRVARTPESALSAYTLTFSDRVFVPSQPIQWNEGGVWFQTTNGQPHGLVSGDVAAWHSIGSSVPTAIASFSVVDVLGPTRFRLPQVSPPAGGTQDVAIAVRSGHYAVAPDASHGITAGTVIRAEADAAPLVQVSAVSSRLLRIAEAGAHEAAYGGAIGNWSIRTITVAAVGSVTLGRPNTRISYEFGYDTTSDTTPTGAFTAISGTWAFAGPATTNTRLRGRQLSITATNQSDLGLSYDTLTASPVVLTGVSRSFVFGRGAYNTTPLYEATNCTIASFTANTAAGGCSGPMADIENGFASQGFAIGAVRSAPTIIRTRSAEARVTFTTDSALNVSALADAEQSTVVFVDVPATGWASLTTGGATPPAGVRILLDRLGRVPQANEIYERGVRVTRDTLSRTAGGKSWRTETGYLGQPAPYSGTQFRMQCARVAVNAGGTVTISGWVRASRIGSDCGVQLILVGADLTGATGGVITGNIAGSATVANDWQRIDLSFQPTASAVIGVEYRQFGGSLTGWLDGLEVSQTS